VSCKHQPDRLRIRVGLHGFETVCKLCGEKLIGLRMPRPRNGAGHGKLHMSKKERRRLRETGEGR
jgi:uncharacterized protein YbbK (DUF523 family)